ncbi:hypothetical protein NHX12_001124 [Muraenolepis orangiensis]|uniref:C2H2-type domain-containing protein n=1 Tax=Muraenolepis orangiensis TaxID=630683 RepID=A0A9Q0E1H1_9TELE|nr:hypothetical protein NHX12_001124 [Muraenolepis orangiensis]
MSSGGGVASDGSVTLTLAEAQGMLEGVTLNLNHQGPGFPGVLSDVGLQGSSSGSVQPILLLVEDGPGLEAAVKQGEGEESQLRNQCFYCSQMCHNANALRRHCKQTHGKDRCHVCRVCAKAFKRATHLKCDKAFNQKSALQVHMVKHTGNKPFKCDVCSIRFTQKSNMKHHMKRTHGYGEPGGGRGERRRVCVCVCVTLAT